MAEKEQVKPLAPTVASPLHSDEEKNAVANNHRRRKNFIKCCGCVSAITIIIAVVMIILAFTVFRVRGPIVKMNSITTVGDLSSSANNNNSLTLVADVSVKNPNSASFRYNNATTTVFYGGASVGEGQIPAGVARARRTVRTNLTVEISLDKIFSSPRLTGDLASGSLTMESFTRIEGRVKIANIVKRRVVVKLNCTMVYGISSQTIEKQDCEHDVNL